MGKVKKKVNLGSPWSGFLRLKGGTTIMFGFMRLLHVVFIIETTIQECYLDIHVGANEFKQAKINVKTSFFCNSCYICLCGAALMACESWKVVLIE
jgi:hypothetical protein